MAQLFPRSANTLAKWTGRILLLSVLGLAAFAYIWIRSPYSTRVHVAAGQTVPFSHKHHVDELGIDCRFCHTSAARSSYAGIPATETCMKCHSVIWKDSPMLAPVRESYKTGKPLVWKRVHDLPDHVYFDHSIHVSRGIGCVTCHGQIDKMPLTSKANTLRMEWCLGCHRDPQKNLRPKDEVFNVNYVPPKDVQEQQARWFKEEHVKSETNCNVCHR